MGKAKTAASAFALGCKRSALKQSDIVNGDPVLKTLQPAVQKNYDKIMAFWLEYQSAKPDASVDNLESLKGFIRTVAYSMDGQDFGDHECMVPGWETVRKTWNNFTAAWQRVYPRRAIGRGEARSVTEFIQGPLAEEMGMPKHKRERRFAGKTTMYQYAKQLWAADWIEHKSPSTPVDDWGLMLANTYTSSRIGEYVESSCRTGTGRGLYFKDFMFVVFKNEQDMPEFAIQLTRDAKNMTSNPGRRPQHALYEGTDPAILCFNPLIPIMARLLAYGAFENYSTVDELLRISPPDDGVQVLEWKSDFLETPFFRSQSSDNIETAGAFSRRLRELGLRAGYPTPPRNHDIRAEGLHLMDKLESEATRMVYAGHTDPGTLAKHYLPRNGADGQAAYQGNQRRTLVLDLFRQLTISRNPELWQCLPAKKQYEFHQKPEIVAITDRLSQLQRTNDPTLLSERKSLYATKRQAYRKHLRDWQRNQRVNCNDPPGYHRAIFNRVRFLMPERDRLAHNLFQVARLRSPEGLGVLSDMLRLYEMKRNVSYRPGLEPEKCRCKRPKDDSYDWRHVYNCQKADLEKIHGFAEMCFLCNDWSTGIEAWENHCQYHLDNASEVPIWSDPLVYGGVLARAGTCPFCFADEGLNAAARMHQFTTRYTWRQHIQSHLESFAQEGAVPTCPRPHSTCPMKFDTILELKFHLQDAFGVDCGFERKRKSGEESPPSQRMKRKRLSDQTFETTGTGLLKKQESLARVNPDTSAMKRSPLSLSPDLSLEGGDYGTCDTLTDEATRSACSSPLSFVVSDDVIDPALYGQKENMSTRDVEFQGTCESRDALTSYSRDVEASAIVSLQDTEVGGGLIDMSVAKVECHKKSTVADIEPAEAVCDAVFEVERLVAKGRIGKQAWYKVKWKDYPESENSWVRKRDIGLGAISHFETQSNGKRILTFERIVSKREVDGRMQYEVKWEGQGSIENVWVERSDVSTRAIRDFENAP